MNPSFQRLAFTTTLALILLSSCTVGPDFVKPEAPDVKDYTAEPLPETLGPQGKKQQFYHDKDVPANWWKLYQSPTIDALVAQALKANPTLQSAQASLRQAKENYEAGKGPLFPSVNLNPYVSRQSSPGAVLGLPDSQSLTYSLYNATVNVSYGLDLFGLNRRNLEALKASEDNERFNATATYVTLTANVITAAIQEASLIAQVKETEESLALQRKQLEIVRTQFDLGAVAKTAVVAQENTIAQTEASLPVLKRQLAMTHNQLAALTGRFPNDKLEGPLDLSTLHLPEELPLSLPSKLVEQRPDIKAAESLLHNASASIGVATANMLPQITLTANYGRQSTSSNTLFSPDAVTWYLQSSLLQPVFRGGQLFHQRKAAIANYENAAAAYQSTVLTAFQNVADSLNALQYNADAELATGHAEETSRINFELAQTQFNAGSTDYVALLDAERSYHLSRMKHIQAQADRYASTAALFQSLGGGWWNEGKNDTKTPAATPTAAEKHKEEENTKND